MAACGASFQNRSTIRPTQTMKVILAGAPKTGTKTLVHIFRSLEYNVYDYEENFDILGHHWMKIYEHGATIDDFRKMYEGVDVVSDVPACFFWEQISQAYPDAKIILMVRDSADVWYESITNQGQKLKGTLLTWLSLLSPTAVRHFRYWSGMARVVFGGPPMWPWNRYSDNSLVTKMWYKRHNCHVLQAAPKDKLLVYNIKEGWGPLCKFLEIDEPSYPFPHRNKKGVIVDEILLTSPVFQRIKKEVLISLGVIALATGAAAWCWYSKPDIVMKMLPASTSV